MSCHSLGQWYGGWGKQPSKALAAYKYACEEYNFGPSCLSYGTALLFGDKELPRGMHNLGATQDLPGAYRSFERGCYKGEDPGRCCVALAEMKIKGYGSHKPQPEEGMKLYEDACFKMNFPKACYILGSMSDSFVWLKCQWFNVVLCFRYIHEVQHKASGRVVAACVHE